MNPWQNDPDRATRHHADSVAPPAKPSPFKRDAAKHATTIAAGWPQRGHKS